MMPLLCAMQKKNKWSTSSRAGCRSSLGGVIIRWNAKTSCLLILSLNEHESFQLVRRSESTGTHSWLLGFCVSPCSVQWHKPALRFHSTLSFCTSQGLCDRLCSQTCDDVGSICVCSSFASQPFHAVLRCLIFWRRERVLNSRFLTPGATELSSQCCTRGAVERG